MTDFELRIGPKATSPEPKPAFNHKTWTRPGYHPPPPRASPKKPHTMRRSGDFNMHTRTSSASEGEPSLLARMGLDVSSPSRSGNADHGSPNRRKRFSTRNGEDSTEGHAGSRITLGKHHVEPPPSIHDDNAKRGVSFNGNVNNGENRENMDISVSPVPTKRIWSPPNDDWRYSPREPYLGVDSPRGRASSFSSSRLPASPAISSISKEASSFLHRSAEEPEHSWFQLPLKDRIAPIVRQNANLRLSRGRHGQNNSQDEPSLDSRIVDKVLTPEICKSIVDSLYATRTQLAETNIQSTNSGQSINQHIKPPSDSPAAITTPQTPVPDTTHIPSLPTPVSIQSSPMKSPSVAAQINASQGHVLGNLAAGPSSIRAPQEEALTGSVAQPAQQEPIPIPFVPAFFNAAPVVSAHDTSSSASITPHVQLKHGRDNGDDSKSTQRRLSSPNPRPHKRQRSRSPLPSSSHQHYKEKDRGKDKVSSPPPARRERSRSTSTSSPHRRRKDSTHTTRRSRRTPSRPRSSTSTSHLRRSQSPRRDSNHSSSRHHRPSSSRQIPSPSRTRELDRSRDHSSSYPSKESSGHRPSLTSHKSSSATQPVPQVPRERYVTKYELKRRAQEAKKEEKREKERSERRKPSTTLDGVTNHQQSSSSAGKSPADDSATSPQAPGSTTGTTSLLTPTTSTASINDPSSVPRPIDLGTKVGLDKSLDLVPDVASQPSAQSAAEDKEASVDADVDMFAMSIDVEPLADAQVGEREDLHPWKPFSDVPGIWLLKQGLSGPDVFEETFEIAKEISEKWLFALLHVNMEKSSTMTSSLDSVQNQKARSSSMLSWRLKCVPTEIGPVREILNNSGTAKNLLQELSQLQSQWPPKGKLIIELNSDHAIGKTIYAKDVDPALPYVELKNHIQPGSNHIRFIQLGDMSKYVFMLYATPISMDPECSHLDTLLEDLQSMLQKSMMVENGSTSTIAKPVSLFRQVLLSPGHDRTEDS